jgi:hypothetical protein
MWNPEQEALPIQYAVRAWPDVNWLRNIYVPLSWALAKIIFWKTVRFRVDVFRSDFKTFHNAFQLLTSPRFRMRGFRNFAHNAIRKTQRNIHSIGSWHGGVTVNVITLLYITRLNSFHYSLLDNIDGHNYLKTVKMRPTKQQRNVLQRRIAFSDCPRVTNVRPIIRHNMHYRLDHFRDLFYRSAKYDEIQQSISPSRDAAI